MKATITVEMDNAAFEVRPLQELGRIIQAKLRATAETWSAAEGDIDAPLSDSNGNKVGRLQVEVE